MAMSRRKDYDPKEAKAFKEAVKKGQATFGQVKAKDGKPANKQTEPPKGRRG